MEHKVKKIAKKIFSVVMFAATTCSLFTAPIVKAAEVSGWSFVSQGGANGWMEIDNTESEGGRSSLKIVNNTPTASNVYINVTSNVQLEAGKSYDIQLQVKSKNSSSLKVVMSWDKRYDLLPFGQTYDWTNFEFVYRAKQNDNNFIGILVEGITEGVWVDDVIVRETGTTENLVKNSGFENENAMLIPEQSAPEGSDVADGSLLDVYSGIRSSESFSIEDMEKVRGAFKYMPVYRAENINVDGDASDWESYPAISMPTLPTQYTDYMKDGKPKDIEAKSRFAFDDENFYFMIEVTDDKYVYYTTDTTYWKGDSIQLSISGMNEKYGSEIGLIHDTEKNEGKIFGTVINQQESSAYLKLSTSQQGNKTIYEMKFPWHVKFDEIPEQFLFDFLINDNDGDGRRYVAELAPGIAEGKVNSLFPVLEIMNTNKDWYGWIESDRSAYIGEEETFEYYLVNQGDERTFTVENSLNGTSESVTVPANSGIRREIKHIFGEAGDFDVNVKIKSDTDEFISKTVVKSEKKPPDNAYAEALAKKLETNAKSLETLIDECEVRGIPTNYETVTYMVLGRFAQYMRDDIANNDLSRVYYTEDVCDKMFEKAKVDLESYISGEKEAKAVPEYITSDMRIDGKTTWAMTEYEGKYEERPVFFVGYGHFATSRKDLPLFNDFGANAIQNEIGPTQAMTSDSAWTVYESKDPDMEYSTSVGNAFEGETALKVVYKNEITANQYVSFYQSVSVEPGKTYEMKFMAKGNNVSDSGVFFSANDFSDRVHLTKGSYDWTEYKTEFVASEGKTSTVVRFLVQGPVSEVLFDAVTFCEKGSDKNLLTNGGFENFGKLSYSFNENMPTVKNIISMLEDAEKNNVAVSVLVSPHYFMTDIIEEYGIGVTKTSFLKYNVNADIAREIIEKYLRGIIPLIKDYKSLNNICITNEPQFWVDGCGDFYLADWQSYLAEVYSNDISKLNQAYKTSYSGFNEVDFVRYENDFAKEYDYKKFNDKVFAEWHKWMADIIKEIAPDVPLNAKVMGYVASDTKMTAAKFQNNGTGYENYTFLEINGCDNWNFLGTMMPLEKNMWYDYMCSVKNAPVTNSEDHLTADGNVEWSEVVSKYAAQDVYQGAIHGRYMSNVWTWERTYDRSSALYGHVLQRPDELKMIGDVTLDLNRLAYEITALQNEEVEVGVLYSESDLLVNKLSMRALYESYAAGIYNGKPVKFITESHIDTMNDYEIITVPNTKYLSEQMLDALCGYVDNGGKVIILGDSDALKWDVHALKHDINKVNHVVNNSMLVDYMGVTGKYADNSSPELGEIFRDVLKEKNLYYVSVVDAQSGEPVYEVEYNVGAYNGKVIVNLVNYTPDRDVKIYIGGKLVTSSKERRSETVLGETVHLMQYEPIMLEIEADSTFFDTYDHWAKDNISDLKNKGIINGVSESRYKPDNTTTRAEFLALAMRASGLGEAEYQGNISDVVREDWFAKTIASAVNNGIIGTDMPFRPNENITREEMCVILVKCYEAVNGEVVVEKQADFTDNYGISDKNAVNKAVSLGLMHGRDDGSFGASDFATRAESATVISRMLK